MSATETRRLTIPQWRELAQSGTVLPMRIPLDGDSMRPLIRRGKDMVTFLPVTRPLQRGDVVLFEYPAGRYVAHRIFRISFDEDTGRSLLEPGALAAGFCRAGIGGTAGKERTADPTGSPCRPVAWARMDGRSAPAARLVAMPGAGGTMPERDGMEEVSAHA